MKVTFKQAVNKMCGDEERLSTFKFHLKQALRRTESGNLILREGDVAEIQDGLVTISLTWENISAINNITGAYCDLIYPEDADKVFNQGEK